MMMISNNNSQSPFYSETSSMAIPPPMSTFNTPCRTVMPRPSVAVAMTMLSPKEAPTEPSPNKKRRCRKVEFGPDITLAYIESAFEYTQVEKDDRWYRHSQISSFKENARRLCRTRMDDVKNNCVVDTSNTRHSVRKNENAISNSAVDCDERNDTSADSIRGLDVYYPSRQRYGKKYIQCVLEAYHVRCVGNDLHVALLAEKWSKKNHTRAVVTGKKDFLVAYFPEEIDFESLPEEKVMLASTLMHGPQRQQRPKILSTSAEVQ